MQNTFILYQCMVAGKPSGQWPLKARASKGGGGSDDLQSPRAEGGRSPRHVPAVGYKDYLSKLALPQQLGPEQGVLVGGRRAPLLDNARRGDAF